MSLLVCLLLFISTLSTSVSSVGFIPPQCVNLQILIHRSLLTNSVKFSTLLSEAFFHFLLLNNNMFMKDAPTGTGKTFTEKLFALSYVLVIN